MDVRGCFCMELLFFATVMVASFIWLGWVVLDNYSKLHEVQKEQSKRLDELENMVYDRK